MTRAQIASETAASRACPGAAARIGSLLGPLCTLAAVGGAWLVMRSPRQAFPWVMGTLLVLVLLWILASSLHPAIPDRRCPGCGRESLERSDADSTHGLRCAGCGWFDRDASSFLLAEQEGALEELARARRGGERVAERAPRREEAAR